VFINDSVTSRARQQLLRVTKFEDICLQARRQEVMEQMWYAAEDCCRSVQRRLEKLGRHRL